MSFPIALTPGTVIGGHYIIGDLINRGGFGAVYRGVDTSEGNRPCAIKEIYDVTPTARRQALMEASVLFTIRSKHLPEVYDALEANGRFYLIMQLIEGQDLLQLLKGRIAPGTLGEQQPRQLTQGPCSEAEAMDWLLPIMDVLQELHGRNPPIMHRDIKPGNIILTPRQTAVLVDFGLTKLYDPLVSTQTMGRAVTEGFSPVEQYVGKTSPQSDIYSMAATMYLLLTNRLPPSAMTRSMQDTLIPPRQLNPSLTPKVERALLKALAVHADQRYQSMREFAEALRDPGFQGYADQTLVSPPVAQTSPAIPVAPQAKTQAAPITPRPKTPTAKQAATPPPRANSPRAAAPAPAAPAAGYPRVPQPGYGPSQSASYPYLPPGQTYGSAPQPSMQPAQPLPTASGQGCLWGIIGGITTAFLLLFVRNATLAESMIVGCLFCILSGYLTVHRGGSSARGGWAGMWTSVIGFGLFWITLFTGLLFVIVPMVFRRFPHVSFAQAWSRAWQTVLPPDSSGTPHQSSLAGLAIAVGIYLAVAFLLGWSGGLLGRRRYGAKMARRARKAAQVMQQGIRANP